MLIRTRLQLLVGLILASFVLLVLLIDLALNRAERIAADLVGTHLGEVIDNSARARSLYQISARIELLSRTFSVQQDTLAEEGEAVQAALIGLLKAVSNEPQRILIERYSNGFDDYLASCLQIIDVLNERRTVDTAAHATLDELERLISDWLIEAALNGRETDYVDQLLGLITGYRESLLRVGMLFSEQDAPRPLRLAGSRRTALDELDDLHLRLQTISASTPRVSELGRKLTRQVDGYRETILRLRLRTGEWERVQQVLRGIAGETVVMMDDMDATSLALATRSRMEIEHVVDQTKTWVQALSLLVIVVMGLAVAFVARRHIETPLRKISRAIEEIKPGALAQPLGLELKNEWGTIEQALDRLNAELFRSYATIRESEARYRLLVENQTGLVVKIDSAGRFLYVSRVYCETFGKEEEELLGRSFMPLVHEEDRKATAQAMKALYRPPHTAYMEHRALTQRGWRWLGWSDRAVLGDDGSVIAIIGVGRDITVEKEQRLQLEHVAHYDALTDLPNRVLLANRLQATIDQEPRHGLRLAVVYIDLDGFKEINDTYGHDFGDHFLIVVARRLRDTLRRGDTIARLGGDEFVAVLVDLASEEDAIQAIQRLLSAAAQPVRWHDRVLKASASLGVTFYPQSEPIGADQLLRQADQAMYRAKLSGKNRFRLFDDARGARGHETAANRDSRHRGPCH